MSDKDLVVYKQITHKGISVVLKVDFLTKQISLCQFNQHTDSFKPKDWCFVDRGQEYLGSWINIMEAMQVAVRLGNDLLQERADDDMKQLAETLYKVQKLEKQKIKVKTPAKPAPKKEK